MRRHLLTMLAVIMASTLSLKAQTILIDDGFENGIQGSIWTQEFVVGHAEWGVESVEDGLEYPSTAWQGSKRAYLRNTSGETQGYVTRLVSKVMDLSPEKVYQPELTFWYANPKWTADRDTLRVLYKTSEKGNWRQLAEFSSASANWQKVRLELPEVNATYQIAFEGKDNLGRGIVLDSVKLRSAPQCTVPHDLSFANQGGGKITLAWLASWDANSYDVIIAKEIIDPDTVANVADSLIAANTSVDGLFQNVDLQLESGEYYYAYVRSVCETENSAWNSEAEQGQFHFRVKATKYVPYSYDFNLPYDGGFLHRDLEWTWGNNTGKYNPFINTNENDEDRAKRSRDASTCIVFSGANNTTTAIPANNYAYVASPAIADSLNANFALNQCVVRFWSTVYQATGRAYAHSLIVGVMTDPEDFTTFVPVDTVSVWGTSTFVENEVDLSSYQGDGMYLAFASNFDTKNLFYIDDLTIEYKPALRKVTKISVNPRDTYADISWEGEAAAYNVLITNTEVDPSSASVEQIVDRAENVTGNTYKCVALEADHSWNRPYYVYVQAIGADGVSEWSYRYPFVTIASALEVPFSFDFEQKDGAIYTMMSGTTTTFYPSKMGIFTNDPEFPHLYTSNYYKGTSCLYLTMDAGNDSWITLPPVENLKDKQITFYLSGSSTPAQAHATLGIMTNPMDINTFNTVSDFTLASSGYTLCYANFANYEGPQGIIAIRWSDIEGLAKKTINYIDELKVEEIAKCLPPVNIQFDAKTDTATISWDKSEATTWEMIFANSEITETQREMSFADMAQLEQVIWADTVTWTDPLNNPEFGFGNLEYNTPYFVYIRTLCGEEKTWWTVLSFTTPCPDEFAIPYFDDFESYESVNLTVGCWVVRNQGATTYPKVASLTVGDSKKAVDLYSTSAGSSYMAIPGVSGDLSQMQLSFDVRTWGNSVTTAPKAYLIVGSMGDFEDPNTFVGIDTFYLCGAANYQRIVMDLADYNLAYDNIVFTSGLPDFASRLPSDISFTVSDVALDNVALKPNKCIEAWDIKATDIQANSLDIAWKGKVENDQWEVKVLKKYAKLENNEIAQYDAAKDAIVNDTVITGKAFHVEGLTAKTLYYFYIRSLCGDSIWVVDSLKSGCVKLDPTKPNKETFENYPSGTSYKAEQQADCWSVGNGNPSATTTYIPYIYKTSATYAASGTNAYRLYPTTTYSPTWVATPEIDCNSLTELAVTFSYYGAASYYILPGVMTDPEDLSTFVVLDSIKCEAKIVTRTIDLSDYADTIPAGAKYFAWRTAYNAGPTIYLDDVSVIKITCPLTKPSYSELTSDGLRVSSGLRTNNNWELLLTDSLISLDSLAVEGFVIPKEHIAYRDTIDKRNKLVEGLEGETMYYGYTRSICDGGEASQWAEFSFRTPCKPLTPEAMGTITFSKKDGYVAGTAASRYMPCWTVGNKSGNAGATTAYIPNVTSTSTYLHSGDSVLRVYSYVSSSTSYDGAYAIMPQLDVDDISKYQVNFFARTNTSTAATYHEELIIGIITDPSDLNTFTVVDTLKLSRTGYEAFTVSFEDYQGDYLGNQGKYIMFMTETGISGATAYGDAYIASISVEKIPTCRPVVSFEVDSIAEDVAVVSWKGYTEKYRVLVADKELKESEKPTYNKWLVDSVVNHADSVLIKGLDAASHYYVYAQGICGEGDSTTISMASAHIFTDCPVVNGYNIPYYVDFDHNTANGTGKRPDCWDGVQLTFDTVGTTQSYPYVYSIKASSVSEPYVLYFYSYGYWNNTDKKFTTNYKSIAVAPKVKGNLTDYMVSFYAKKTSTSSTATSKYGDKLWIGYVTDASQEGMATTFVKIAAVDVTTTTQSPYQVILSDYVSTIPEGARIALKADWSEQGFPESSTFTANTYLYAHFYVDNFKIGFPPSCYPPILEAGNSTLTTAEINITPAKIENDHWHLAIVPDSIYTKDGYDAAKYLASSDVRIVDADSANFVVSGLTAGTKYWVYGRTACGGDDGNSAWSDMATPIRTKYYFKDSYYFGFGREEGWEFCKNSTSTTYWINPAIEIGYEGGNATTSYTSYYPYCMGNTTSAIYAYGPREASDPKNAALRWQATATYWGGYAIFPAVEEAHDRSFEFKMRCGYGSYNSTKDTIGLSTNYSCEVEIGTIDKNKGFETYQVIANISKEALPKVRLTEENDWLWSRYTMDLDSATVADKQIVIRLSKQEDSNTRYLHFDDVTLGAPKGFGMVSINKVIAEATKATVKVDNIGSPWNLYITTYDEKTKKTDTVASFLNKTDLEYVVEGLTPQSSYKAILVAASAPKDTKFDVSAIKDFKTPCLPLEPNAQGEFFWNFNDRSDWERSDVLVGGAEANKTDTCYWKPGCFTVGTTYASAKTTSNVYYNWLIQRKGYGYTGAPTSLGTTATSALRYEYGRYDSPALRIYSTSTYMTPYLVLPELHCSFDTMMIEFYGRPFANYAENYGTAGSQNKILSASTYLGTSYSKAMIVGTLTDPNDFSTLEVIDTLYYSNVDLNANTLVNQDPAGLRYWEKMQLPLASAKGKYIVLFPPKEKSCLFFVDDLSVKAVGDNLFAPGHAKTGEVTKTTAEFSWEVKHPTLQSVVVVLDQDGNQEILRDTIVGTEYKATGLKPNTGYQWYMYQTNGSKNTSMTGALTFYTECLAVTPDYKTGFEIEDGWRILPAQTSVTYKQAMCWTYENAGTAAVGTNAYNMVNGSSLYSHSGGYAAKFYAYGTTQQNYLAMPEIEDVAAYDTLQLNFYMRPTYVTASTGKLYSSYLGATYSKAVIVGTMDDPDDPSTFVAIDTLNYTLTPGTNDVANEANDFFFQKMKVVLTGAKGKHVAFMATLYAKGDEKKYTYDYVYLDDVWFSPIQHCEVPTDLTASEISATSAKLSWTAPEGADKYRLQVSTDFTFADESAMVFDELVSGTSQVIAGLKGHTEYTWRIMTICEEDLGQSDYTQNSSFITLRTPFYGENFSAATIDADWSFGTNPALLVIDSTNVEITGSNSTSYGFKRITNSYGIAGAHYCVPMYSSTTTTTTSYDYYWMISPVISLSETEKAHLTFDIALTQVTSGYTPSANAVTEANMANDYVFAIAVSEDGGKTWKKENILAAWSNQLPAGSQLRDIPATATGVRFNLEKYAGKNIRIAFYRQAETYLANGCAVHFGNIRIANYQEFAEAAAACQYHDIEQNGFFIDGDQVKAGPQRFTRYEFATDVEATAGALDTIYTLNAEIFEAPETIIADTICEGESYTDINFTGKNRTGVYRRKLQSVLNCDSIITLKLFVAPIEKTNEFDTICYGSSVTWHGKVYDRSGLYSDTLISMHGCDSIIYLSLFVRDQITGEQHTTICHGATYAWNGKVYNQPGTYKETLTSVTGCDSIATLVLDVSDIIHGEPQKETICHGGKFSWNGKVYDKAGVYTDTIQSAFGCDSVNTLELSIAPIIQGAPVEQTICQGATYTWNGKIFDKAGTYKDTLVSEAGCDSIAVIILKVSDILIGNAQKQAICEGATFTWNGKVYDKAGTYKDTLQSSGGCDSVATLELSVSAILRGEPEKVSVCENEPYAWNGKTYTSPGTYVDTVASSFGCDSIITLVLTYFGAEDTIHAETTIALADLPFTYENAAHPYAAGQSPIYYAVGTEIGVYSDTVLVEGKNCTAVMVHTLTIVEKLEGVDNIGEGEYGLLPNIIRAGETVTAYGNFTGTVHVQVYDIVGRLIKEERNAATSSITIDAFPQSGMYTVRIADSNATQYVGRVLVK